MFFLYLRTAKKNALGNLNDHQNGFDRISVFYDELIE